MTQEGKPIPERESGFPPGMNKHRNNQTKTGWITATQEVWIEGRPDECSTNTRSKLRPSVMFRQKLSFPELWNVAKIERIDPGPRLAIATTESVVRDRQKSGMCHLYNSQRFELATQVLRGFSRGSIFATKPVLSSIDARRASALERSLNTPR